MENKILWLVVTNFLLVVLDTVIILIVPNEIEWKSTLGISLGLLSLLLIGVIFVLLLVEHKKAS